MREMTEFETYCHALDVSPVAMLVIDRDDCIRHSNPAADTLFRYPRGALGGRPFEVLVPDELRDLHRRHVAAFRKAPRARQIGATGGLACKTGTGEIVSLEIGLEPVSIDGQQCIVLAATDSHERVEKDRDTRRLLDASASAMLMVDRTGTIVFANKVATRTFGYVPGEMVGKPIDMLVPERLHEAHRGHIRGYFGGGVARPMGLGRELHARHRTGREFPVEVGLTPIETPEGTMVMATLVDLTAHVAAERALSEKVSELDLLNEQLRSFAYSASHDLKAPLASVSGLMRLCLDDMRAGDTAEVMQNLHLARDIADDGVNRVEKSLGLALAGHQEHMPEPVAVEALVAEVWRELTWSNQGRARLVTDMSLGGPFVTDRPALRVILDTLLSNAVRFRDEAKAEHVVTVTASDESGWLLVHVSDNGVGVPEESRHLLFKMFGRISERSGGGLGLALAKKLVDRLGGEIRYVDSRRDGAEFAFTLPMAREPENAHSSDSRRR